MSDIEIRVQGDDEIPTHIVSTVDPESVQKEQAKAKQLRLKPRKRGGAAHRADVSSAAKYGLTEDISPKEKLRSSGRGVKRVQDDEEEEEDNHRALLRSWSNQDPEQSKRKTEDDMTEEKENDTVVTGRAMFGFTQHKARSSAKSMMKKAIPDNVTKDQKENNDNEDENTRSTRRKRKARVTEEKTDESVVNHAKRRRIQRAMELLKDDRKSDDEESGKSDEEESEKSEEEEVQEEEEEDDDADQAQPQDTFEQDATERYFESLQCKSKTSNNTLSNLPVLEPHEFRDLLAQAPKKHEKEIKTLAYMHEQYFPQWYFELTYGFNLLCYGYGSKRELLNRFAQTALTDGALLIVNGYHPVITIKDILLQITDGVMQTAAPVSQLQDHVRLICDYFSSPDREYDKLYLVVHNIDGGNLRTEQAQEALSSLAHAPNIHIVASVDNINFALLWDHTKMSRFNWICHDTTTFDDYLVETTFESSLMVKASDTLGGARGVQYVLRSLHTNAKGIFKILAENQLMEMELAGEEGQADENVGLSYQKLYSLAREGFFVSNDLAFQTILGEFLDHKVFVSKRLLDGAEVLYIPLDKSSLSSIIVQEFSWSLEASLFVSCIQHCKCYYSFGKWSSTQNIAELLFAALPEITSAI